MVYVSMPSESRTWGLALILTTNREIDNKKQDSRYRPEGVGYFLRRQETISILTLD